MKTSTLKRILILVLAFQHISTLDTVHLQIGDVYGAKALDIFPQYADKKQCIPRIMYSSSKELG